jgi:hypothetical protein
MSEDLFTRRCPTCSCGFTEPGTLIIYDIRAWVTAPCPCPTCEADASRRMIAAGQEAARRAAGVEVEHAG